jgi:hypothetical protein
VLWLVLSKNAPLGPVVSDCSGRKIAKADSALTPSLIQTSKSELSFCFSATNQYTALRRPPAISFCVLLKNMFVPSYCRLKNQGDFILCEIAEASVDGPPVT